ncbi:MAG: nucleoside hydrolase [Bacteroidetes bacterium]|jgi:inosine-uridine nucleoside N-ribohydrolase|nr:nucleoside hydrolase [Bacteroidota bacterium]
MKLLKNMLMAIITVAFISCNPTENENSQREVLEFEPVQEFILDADTGNELDDLYAIVRAVIDEEVTVTALTSAHFNNPQLVTDSLWHIYPTENINTVQISQDINENLLETLDRTEIPHPKGADRMVGYAWGYYEGAQVPESPATDFIIERAMEHSPSEKLNVVTVGAVTNVAAALLQEPSIAENIRLFALSMRYNEELNAWDKNSFNARNDINGLDLILSNEDLEFYVIPGNVSRTLTFQRQETLEKLSRWDHPTVEILERRWDEVSAGDSWIMWDLALVEAIIHPEWATFETVAAPPENGGREIYMISDIDEDQMRNEFWRLMNEHFGEE